MSGHSKWAQIKRKKGATDQKRGALFSRYAKEIQTAARSGGGDPKGNMRLRALIDKAKSISMPADNIEKAILRGTGQIPGVTYEEVTYEGFGAGGVAVIAECLTDSRNRTSAGIRHIFTKHAGSMGAPGCVMHGFSRQGVIIVNAKKYPEDLVLEEALNAGAEDIQSEGDVHEIRTAPDNVDKVAEALKAKGIVPESAEASLLPLTLVAPPVNEGRSAMKLIAALEEDEDVQRVYSNLEPSEELFAEME